MVHISDLAVMIDSQREEAKRTGLILARITHVSFLVLSYESRVK
jgi:hypothetical protein